MVSPVTDYTTALGLMRAVMAAHPWWKRRCVGTPLENDLPALAAEIMCKGDDQQSDPYFRQRDETTMCADCIEDHGQFYCTMNCGPRIAPSR